MWEGPGKYVCALGKREGLNCVAFCFLVKVFPKFYIILGHCILNNICSPRYCLLVLILEMETHNSCEYLDEHL